MPVKLKICGITRLEDARIAANLGADALGFIFFPKSPRYITPANARAIIDTLPPFVTRVGVFVDQTPEEIMAIVNVAGVNAVQLHGAEPPEVARRLPLPVIKAFGVQRGFNLGVLADYPVAACLLDTWDTALAGGTGKCFDWSVARQAVDSGATVILAGGLGPSNLTEAIEAVRPYAVDVNSGVEVRPGEKNPNKIRDVIKIIKAWNRS
jgi:phosphoribosylanthranilate isomerase